MPHPRPSPLDYHARQARRQPVAAGTAGAAGFCVAFLLTAATVFVLTQNIFHSQWIYPFVALALAGGLMFAAVVNWVFAYRGFFAGFLIGIGLFLIFPCATLTVICGRVDKPWI